MVHDHERRREELLKQAKDKGKGLAWQRIVMPGEGKLIEGDDEAKSNVGPERKKDPKPRKTQRKIYTNDSVAGQRPTGDAPKGDQPPSNELPKKQPIPKSNSF